MSEQEGKSSFVTTNYVCNDLDICRTTLWKMIKLGVYQKPVQLIPGNQSNRFSREKHESFKAALNEQSIA